MQVYLNLLKPYWDLLAPILQDSSCAPVTHDPVGGQTIYIAARKPSALSSRCPPLQMEDQFIPALEDSRALLLNVSRVMVDSGAERHQYAVWLPGIGIAAVYGMIILVGLVGNVTLMKTCLLVKSMRTVPNLFLSSLALGTCCCWWPAPLLMPAAI